MPGKAGDHDRDEALQRRLAVVGIIVEEQREAAASVRNVLDRFSNIILLRNGVPHGRSGTGVLSVILYANTNELGALTGKLGMIRNVRVRSVML